MIEVPVAYGDAFDKLTILEIKAIRLESPAARHNVLHERRRLGERLSTMLHDWEQHEELTPALNDLRSVNGRLWDLENNARMQLSANGKTLQLAETAAEIFARNEQRAFLKRRINDILNSPLVEEKQYAASAASSIGLQLADVAG